MRWSRDRSGTRRRPRMSNSLARSSCRPIRRLQRGRREREAMGSSAAHRTTDHFKVARRSRQHADLCEARICEALLDFVPWYQWAPRLATLKAIRAALKSVPVFCSRKQKLAARFQRAMYTLDDSPKLLRRNGAGIQARSKAFTSTTSSASWPRTSICSRRPAAATLLRASDSEGLTYRLRQCAPMANGVRLRSRVVRLRSH